jgi:hypothetical protein
MVNVTAEANPPKNLVDGFHFYCPVRPLQPLREQGDWLKAGDRGRQDRSLISIGGNWKSGPIEVLAFRRCCSGELMTATLQRSMVDKRALEYLNHKYIHAFLMTDLDWFDEYLADDFIYIESDGLVLNRAQFLSNSRSHQDVAWHKVEDIQVNIYGDVGVVHGTAIYGHDDGSSGISRFINIYLRKQGAWKVVSAQIVRASSIGDPECEGESVGVVGAKRPDSRSGSGLMSVLQKCSFLRPTRGATKGLLHRVETIFQRFFKAK